MIYQMVSNIILTNGDSNARRVATKNITFCIFIAGWINLGYEAYIFNCYIKQTLFTITMINTIMNNFLDKELAKIHQRQLLNFW